MDKPFQRKGAKSNTHVGKEFERAAKDFFTLKGLHLQKRYFNRYRDKRKKPHTFDLGNLNEKILVECKSHTWTEGGNVPSAKMTTWDQAMYFFYVAPTGYRKIFFVLKNYSLEKKGVKSTIDPWKIECYML